MDPQTYILFTILTAVFIISPGPSAILAVTQGAGNGVRCAFFGILGIATSGLVYFTLSAMGLASLIIASTSLFTAIKWLGAAYLVYLGLKAIFGKTALIEARPAGERAKSSKLYLQGWLVVMANPKAMIYFAAIIPQFLDPARSVPLQTIQMGLTTALLQMAVYTCYAYLGKRLASGGLKKWIVSLINKMAGGALLLAGIKVAST